jgi:hypothetical protein
MTAHQPPRPESSSWLRRAAAGTPTTLGAVASLIAIGGLGFAALKALTTGDSASATVEAKQLIGFRQVADRICVENRQALERALPEARSGVQLLSFLSRGTGWGINDLEGVTAPASLAGPFADEIGVRRRIQEALLEVQHAGETGERTVKAEAVAAVYAAEEAASEVGDELGLEKCSPVLPAKVRRAIDVN